VSASLSTSARAASKPVMPAGSSTGTYCRGVVGRCDEGVGGGLAVWVVWSRRKKEFVLLFAG
jgi:hypothetical protein